jgi:polysaccharide export outer membrane protein
MSQRPSILRASFLMSLLVCTGLCDDTKSAGTETRADANNSGAYILGVGDEITAHSLQVKELADKVFRLGQEGEVSFPLIGRVRLSGSSVPQAEELLILKLGKYYVQPDLELSVSNLHTEPVSVIGAVGASGVHQMKEKTTLLDALSLAGGVRPDAGSVVVITREPGYGPIPYANAHTSPSGESVAEINLKSLLDARDPVENVRVQPHDVIAIPTAQLVFVVGNVKHAGGFTLGGRPTV